MTVREWARLEAALAAGVVVAVLTGCSLAPAVPLTLSDVVAERAAARELPERQRFAAFVEQSSGRLAELGLPVPEFQGMVALDDWGDAMVACINQTDPLLDLSAVSGGFTVNYFGVVGDDYERSKMTIESCQAQIGVDDPAVELTPGAVEAAWRYQDATRRVLPCLRGIGATVPSPPSAIAFVEHVGTGREWTAYSMVAVDPAILLRAVALCPPSSTVLDAHLNGLDGAPDAPGLTPPRYSVLVP